MKFLKNTAFYTVGNLLPKISLFFLLPIYTRYMGPAQYGIAESMSILSSILAVLFSLGIHNSVYRLYYDYKTPEEQAKFFGTINIAIIVLSIASAILILSFNSYVGLLFKTIPFFPYFAYAIVFTLINNLGELPKAFLMIKEKAINYTLIGIGQFIFITAFIFWFVVIKKEGAIGMLKGQVYGSALVLPYLLYFATKNFRFRFDVNMFKNVLYYSLPAIPTIISAWVLNLSDRIFIERYISVSEVGVYSLGYKIAGLVGFVFGAFEMAYMPYFFKLANSNDKGDVEKIRIVNKIYILVLLLVTFSLALFSKELIELFFSNKFHKSYEIIMIVTYVFFFTQAGAILGKNLAQSRKVKQGMLIDISCALLNIGLNFLLIPILGIYGAAWATLFSFIYSFGVYYIYSSRHTFFVPIDIQSILLFLIISVLLLILFNFYLHVGIVYTIIIKTLILLAIVVFGFNCYRKSTFLSSLFNKSDG